MFESVLRGRSVLVDGALKRETSLAEAVFLTDAPSNLRLGDLLAVGHHVAGVHHPRGFLWIRGSVPEAGKGTGDGGSSDRHRSLIERSFRAAPAR